MWRFKPIEKPTIWGGGNIAAYKAGAKGWPAADAPLCRHIGESLELSSMAGCMSVVDGGPDSGLTLAELIDLHGTRIMGKSLYARFGNNFPIMVKLLDASDARPLARRRCTLKPAPWPPPPRSLGPGQPCGT